MKVLFEPQEYALLRRIERYARARKAALYVVGGAVRDRILRRRKAEPDIDFALCRNACAFGRALSSRIRAAYVLLDKEHGACRLIKRVNGRLTTFDFTDFRGTTIEDDLRMRDFTANALAVRLEDFLSDDLPPERVIDPLGGRADIAKGLIRACSQRSFSDDPLRILRGFSFASLFGWKLTPQTRKAMRSHRKKLSLVSGERIRDELFKVLESAHPSAHLEDMDRMGVLAVVFPEIEAMRGRPHGPYHHLDIWEHTLESVRQFEGVLHEMRRRKQIVSYLQERISAVRSRKSLIICACLFHDIGKPRACRRRKGKLHFHGHENIGRAMTVEIGRRLKLSGDEIAALSRMVQAHLRPGFLAENQQVITPRAVYRFFRDTAEEAVGVLLLSLADQRSTRGRLTTEASRRGHEKLVQRLLKEYFRRKEENKPARLVNGDLLMKHCKLSPSPLVGKILAELEELQAIGAVRTRADALDAAAEMLQQMRQR